MKINKKTTKLMNKLYPKYTATNQTTENQGLVFEVTNFLFYSTTSLSKIQDYDLQCNSLVLSTRETFGIIHEQNQNWNNKNKQPNKYKKTNYVSNQPTKQQNIQPKITKQLTKSVIKNQPNKQ